MKDAITISRTSLLHPKLRVECGQLIDKVEAKLGSRIAVRVVQGLRTIEEQNNLYAIGRTVKGANATPQHPYGSKVTNAVGGSSYHNYGLAIDFALLYDKDGNGTYESLSWDLVADLNRDGISDWKEVVSTFTDAGWKWGGDWISLKDNPHLEKTFGHKWDELLKKYKAGDFIPNSKYVNI